MIQLASYISLYNCSVYFELCRAQAPDTILSTVQQFLFESMRRLLQDFNRPLKKSKGRQKIPIPKLKNRDFGENFAIVSPINRQHFVEKEKEKQKKTKERKKKQLLSK